MELRQLEYFVAVAEEANFTRAAERVHISQSGVSAQIQALEKDLGASLINRSGRVATLTGAGTAALEVARRVLRDVEGLRRAVDDVTGVVRGSLAAGMITACAVPPWFEALAAFHADHPGVRISLTEDNSDRLIERIRSGALDLALVGVAGRPPAGLPAMTIISEGLVALVPAGHPWSGRSTVPLSEVCSSPVVTLPVGTGVRAVFDTDCAARGLVPDIALEASAPDAVVDLCARGFGPAVLTETMGASCERFSAIAISDVTTPALLAVVWSPSPSPALLRLLERTAAAFGVRS